MSDADDSGAAAMAFGGGALLFGGLALVRRFDPSVGASRIESA